MEVRSAATADRDEIDAFLEGHGTRLVARSGELVDASQHAALIAEDGGRIVGVLCFIPGPDTWEVLTLHAEPRNVGVGTALMRSVEDTARKAGATELILTTTNDNLDALRFYQRRGFELVQVDPGAVNRSRRELKPGIPEIGEHGIPIRDELQLSKALVP